MDPRELGADCQSCPLLSQSSSPVFCSHSQGPSKLVILSDQPGHKEVERGEPLCGPTGYLLDRNLRARGIERSQCHVTNTLLCCPPKKLSPKEWKKAVECCKPRLVKELQEQEARTIFAAGQKALYATLEKAVVKDWAGVPERGAPPLDDFTIIGCFNPALVFQSPAFEPVFRIWLDRAWKLANGRLPPWKWPEIVVDPPFEPALYQILDSRLPIGVDLETTMAENPRDVEITCLGLATKEVAVSIPWPPENPQVERLARDILSSSAPKIMQNGFGFDLIVFQAKGIEVNNFSHDTLVGHSVYAPGLFHDLDFIAAIETWAPHWKVEYKKGRAKQIKRDRNHLFGRDRETRVYNAKDAYVTCILKDTQLGHLATVNNGYELFQEQMALCPIAVRMSNRGIQVDHTKFAGHRERILKELEKYKEGFEKLVGDKKYKLGKNGQHKDLKTLFFTDFQIEPSTYSEETGQPNLDAAMLETIVGGHNKEAATLARLVLKYRQWYKLLSTYIDGLRKTNTYVVQPIWKPYKTITRRWGCAKPNLQNIPKAKERTNEDGTKTIVTPSLRDLFVSREGFSLVEADYSQLELRIMALLCKDPLLLEWYENGEDVHNKTAEDFFGKDWTENERNLAKTIEYAFNYNMSDDVTEVHKTLVVSHPHLTIPMVKMFRKKWFKAHPNIPAWQRKFKEQAEFNAYVEEPVSGWRQIFHDGRIDINKVLNFPFQSMGATLINRAIIALDKDIDWQDEAILLQVHDALIGEAKDPLLFAAKLKKHMTQTITLDGVSMTFPVDVKYGKDWGNLVKLK